MNVAVVLVAGTTTEAGTVKALEALLASETVPPSPRVSVTVHVVEAFGPSEPAAQVRDDTVIVGTSEIVALLELPFREAVNVALWLDVTDVVEAEKVAVVAPDATVTDAGTVRTVGAEFANATLVALVGAADTVTVQVVEAF